MFRSKLFRPMAHHPSWSIFSPEGRHLSHYFVLCHGGSSRGKPALLSLFCSADILFGHATCKYFYRYFFH
jgi:hypothetical protein